jgi:hypothetical protein
MKSILNSLPILLPIVYAWAEKQESIILAEGIPLNESQLTDARRAGVRHPEKIRIKRVEKLPEPENEDLMFMARQVGLFSERMTTLSLGYGIWFKYDLWDDRPALVHECVHVAQHEKRKGLRPFLAEYLRECIDPGYPFGRMQQESILVTKDICKPLTTKLP